MVKNIPNLIRKHLSIHPKNIINCKKDKYKEIYAQAHHSYILKTEGKENWLKAKRETQLITY